MPIVSGEGSGYAGRIGDSVGSDPDDWVFGTAEEAAESPLSDGSILYELESGIFGVPMPVAFNGRDLDHIGESNFNGGARGSVMILPRPGETDPNGDPLGPRPAEGVTVFADRNGNGRQDLAFFSADPEDAVPIDQVIDGNGNPTEPVITNAFPGVTVAQADVNNDIVGFGVSALVENPLFPAGNRIFASNGISFFNNGSRLRFDFYEPVTEVSIQALGSGVGISPTIGRLIAYNENDEVVDEALSSLLFGSGRQTITVTSASENIAYVLAYTADDLPNSGSFGRFDNLSFRQSEFDAVVDAEGNYELKNLFGGNYDILVEENAETEDLITGNPVPIVVAQNENFEVNFLLGANLPPTVDEEFTFILDENTPVGTTVGTINAIDPNGQALGFTVESGAELGFLIDPVSGDLRVGPNASVDFESNDRLELVVGVTDEFDVTSMTNVVVLLNDVNEAPVFNPVDITVPEGTPDGTPIGQVDALDPDVQQNQSLTFELIGGSGATVFDIDPDTGLVTVIDQSALDFELLNVLNLQVRISDSFTPSAVTHVNQVVRILDQNDLPSITTDSIAIFENSVGAVGQIRVADGDRGQQHRFEVTGGTGSQLFEVSSEGSVLVRAGGILDFESQDTYTLNVRVSDNGSPPLAAEAIVTLSIIDVDEPPVLDVNQVDLPENSPAGTLVTTLGAIDPEGVITSYSIEMLASGDAAD
ncbi:MAG: cadherin repeat domain-containing protein, partial [Pirellulales bacterium]|nr:cadherin repeat domain-containing protein [Pirellulales bacterium]